MSIIHRVATVTAKDQITLPKPIRQALEADAGAKVAFELHEDGQVVVSRADAEHVDPEIGAFLDLLSGDIRASRHVQASPDDLARDMSDHAERDAPADEGIDRDIDL